MQPTLSWFEQCVNEDWGRAVMAATYRFGEVRAQIMAALHSANPEVRSAAVATLNEANDEASHDLVVALAHDSDTHVRDEVLEYIEQFPREADAPLLLECLKAKRHLFLASSALRKVGDENGRYSTMRSWRMRLRRSSSGNNSSVRAGSSPNPSIERTPSSVLRTLPAAAHVKR